ncbi:TPM domain-containing protein [Rhodoferax bucti]|uniref:TPM domain-containing protein n=1 Tax=Rhodoferax bucti TaxID=2576305 RepID=UPI0011081AB1|nr:TPM domain-containing protein [Rhodoferax bucti]
MGWPLCVFQWPRVWWCWLLGGVLAFGAWGVHAQSVQAVPALSSHVVDMTATLSEQQQLALDATLSRFETSHGAQVVVLIVRSTAPEDIAVYANRVASAWKIGRKDIGDGVLLLVAKDDRTLRIEVARTLEGAIPDLMAKRIIDQAIAPRFKQSDFAGGLTIGVEQLMGLIRGEALPAPTATRPQGGFQWMDLAVFLFFAVTVGGRMARRALGTRWGSMLTGVAAGGLAFFVTQSLLLAAGAAVAAFVLTLLTSLNKYATHTGSGGYGGFGSGNSSGSGRSGGGGFSSGGGGSFGGGGASGGW